MKSFGRLLMAAALIVPVGVITAGSAEAAPDNVACTGHTGTLKASTGISLTTRRGITFTVKDGALEGCEGVGISEATTAAIGFVVQRPAVNCKTIKGALFQGSGTIKWGEGSNAGVKTKIKINVKFANLTTIKFSGKVTSEYLRDQKISGQATIPPDLRSAGDNDGKCGNSGASRVKSLPYEGTSFNIG